MGTERTRDGIRISKIIQAVQGIGDLEVRKGTKHLYILNYGNLIPCPVEKSTSARTMLVPWLKQATGFNRETIYQALRKGRW